MPRRPGVYLYRGHFVTKFGCGDGPPIKLCPAKGKSDREARQAAEAELRRLVVERDQGRGRPKLASQLTVEDLALKFLERTRTVRQPATYDDYAAMLRKLVYGFPWKPVPRTKGEPKPEPSHVKGSPFTEGFGALKAAHVSSLAAGEMQAALAKFCGPKTVNNWLIAARACWNWAIDQNLVEDNPFKGLEKLHAQGRSRLCSADEFEKLLAGADETFKPVLMFLRFTPSRPGVVREMTCSDVDSELTHVTMHKTKRSSTSRNKEPWRIPVPEHVRPMLRELIALRGGRGHVFLNERGRAWTKDALAVRFRRLRERAGIGPDERGEKLVLYSSRHTYLTRAAIVVSGPMTGTLGDHADPRTTRRYVHVPHCETLAAAELVAQNLK